MGVAPSLRRYPLLFRTEINKTGYFESLAKQSFQNNPLDRISSNSRLVELDINFSQDDRPQSAPFSCKSLNLLDKKKVKENSNRLHQQDRTHPEKHQINSCNRSLFSFLLLGFNLTVSLL